MTEGITTVPRLCSILPLVPDIVTCSELADAEILSKSQISKSNAPIIEREIAIHFA
jgi:hypothetical protein